MNESEVNNIVTLLVAVAGPLLVKYGISQNDLATALPAVAAMAWGVWSHWNMKKVPENATVVGGPKS